MTRRTSILRARIVHRRREHGGYIAVVTAASALLLFGMAAFSVDIGRWYLTARSVQRAADAGALAGVPYLPANPPKAYSTAKTFTAKNGYNDADSDVAVATELESSTQLKVTVEKDVKSTFGALLGIKSAKIARSATADYSGPVPLGSPCNEFGNDPDTTNRSSNCSTAGQFWANIGSVGAPKANGDAYQNCDGAGRGSTSCPTTANSDYDPDGYFFTITVKKPTQNLRIEVFDPALIHVGDTCESGNLYSSSNSSGWTGIESSTNGRYGAGKSNKYCTGDNNFAGTTGYAGQVATEYTVRDPGPNSWDPFSFPIDTSCEGDGVYPGWTSNESSGSTTRMKDVLNAGNPSAYPSTQATAAYKTVPSTVNPVSSMPNLAPATTAQGYVANVFRKWVPICTIAYAEAGTYMLQVKTNGLGADSGNGHNRFGVRAYSTTDSTAKDSISLSGFEKMGIYANLPDAQSKFHLVRVPSGTAGMTLNVEMFDVGDSTTAGAIKVLPPNEIGGSFSGCTAKGPYTGTLTDCELTNVKKGSGDGGPSDPTNYQGNWEVVSVPIPTTYKCQDDDDQKCWFMLQYTYGTGNQPSDTTSWRAWISGDPIRLIK